MPDAARTLSPLRRQLLMLCLAPFAVVGSLLFVLFLFSILHIARPYYVPNNAMSPTLEKGDHFYSSEITYRWGHPSRGDVVCFWSRGIPQLEDAEHGVNTTFIKRVVGLPGETISIHADRLWVDGQPASNLADIKYEPAAEGMNLTYDGDSFVVPPDSYFVLGDNSHKSLDSRYWGCVPRKNLCGRALFRMWPPQRMGLIN